MAVKERNQKILVGDDATLRFLSMNGNSMSDVYSVEKVEIYYLDQTLISDSNPDGKRLVETVTQISHDDTGRYSVSIPAYDPTYVIGQYLDVWYVRFEQNEDVTYRVFQWEISSDKWYSHYEDLVHGFRFIVKPPHMRVGENRPLHIQIVPEVPNVSMYQTYYRLLEANGNIFITIEQICGECLPQECDLRLVVEDEPVTQRNGRDWMYRLDTNDMNVGVYYVTFRLEIGGNTYISDDLPLSIVY